MNHVTTTPQTSGTRNTRDVAIIALLLVSAAALSIIAFMHQSIRLDEAQSLWQTSRSPAAIVETVGKDVHVPLYHLGLHFWRLFVGDDLYTARAFSLLFYLLTIPVVYALGTLAFRRSVGLFAATLFALSPFMNWYGSEVRMYTLFAFLATLNQYFFIRILKLRDNRAWWGFAITAVLGVFTHYFFLLLLAAQGLFFLWNRERFPEHALRHMLTIAGVVTALFTPWVLYMLSLGEAGLQEPLLITPTLVNVFNTFSEFLFGFQNDHLNTLLVALWPLSILLLFLALRKQARFTVESRYFLFTLVFSITAAFLVSIVVQPVFVSRYLVFTVPVLYLLLAAVFSLYPQTLARTAGTLLVLLMVGGLGIEAVSATTPVKEDYQDVVAHLEAQGSPHDIVLISPPFTIYPVEYYYDGVAPISTLPYWDRYEQGPIPSFSPETLPDDITNLTDSYERVWVMLSYDQGYESEIRQYFETHYHRIEERTYSPGLTLALYRLRYDTASAQQDLSTAQ